MIAFFKKTLSIFLCLTLIDFSGLTSEIFASDQSESVKTKSFNPQSIIKPNLQEYVRIDQFSPSHLKTPFFIHIRDLHCNYEAQMNLSKALEVLWRENNQKELLILVEGAEGLVDTSLFGTFPDKEIKVQASKDFMKGGRITGPEYLSITKYGEVPVRIEGIEDGALYKENFISFRKVMTNSNETRVYIQRLEKILQQIKEKVFSPKLLELDVLEKGLKEGNVDLEKYIQLVKENKMDEASFEKFPNMQIFLKVFDLQKSMNVQKVESERDQLIERLSKVLEKDELAQLIRKSLELRLSKISTAEYFEYLWSQASRLENLEEYPELKKYTELIKEQTRIDEGELFAEFRRMIESLKEGHITNSEQKDLIQLSHVLDNLGKMLQLEMSREDLAFYESLKEKHDLRSVIGEIQTWLGRFPSKEMKLSQVETDPLIEKVLKEGEHFYRCALKRDQVLVQRALEKIKESGSEIAVLITGGFHSGGVAEILKEKGLGYLVMTPRVLSEPNMENYYSLMMDQRIETGTLAFFDLLDTLANRVSPDMQEQELQRFMDFFIKASIRKLGKDAILQWLQDWQDQKIRNRESIPGFIQRLIDSSIQNLAQGVEEVIQPIISEADISLLIHDSDLTIGELTVGVLKALNDPLADDAEREFEKVKGQRQAELINQKQREARNILLGVLSAALEMFRNGFGLLKAYAIQMFGNGIKKIGLDEILAIGNKDVNPELERRRQDQPRTAKAPGSSALDRVQPGETAYIDQLIKKSRLIKPGDQRLIEFAADIVRDRAPPMPVPIQSDMVEIYTVDLSDLAMEDLLGIPRSKDGYLSRNMVFAYTSPLQRDGKVRIYVASSFWKQKLSLNPDMLAQILDEEWNEARGGLLHGDAVKRAQYFSENENELNKFHKFVLDEYGKEWDYEQLRALDQPHPNDPKGLFQNYVKRKLVQFLVNNVYAANKHQPHDFLKYFSPTIEDFMKAAAQLKISVDPEMVSQYLAEEVNKENIVVLYGKGGEVRYLRREEVAKLLGQGLVVPGLFFGKKGERRPPAYVFSESVDDFWDQTALYGLDQMLGSENFEKLMEVYKTVRTSLGAKSEGLNRAIRRANWLGQLEHLRENPALLFAALLLEVPREQRMELGVAGISSLSSEMVQEINRYINEANGVIVERPLKMEYEVTNKRYYIQTYKDAVISWVERPEIFQMIMAHKLSIVEDPDAISRMTDEERALTFDEMVYVWASLAGDMNAKVVQLETSGEVQHEKLELLFKDLAFKNLFPKERDEIIRQVEDAFNVPYNDRLKQYAKNELPLIMGQMIRERIEQAEPETEFEILSISGDLKGPYAVWRKAQYRYGVGKMNDIIRMRILVPSIQMAYVAASFLDYGVDYEDYINAKRKASGYRSLHLVVPMDIPFSTNPDHKSEQILIEIQIMTPAMKAYADYGPASHRIYEMETVGQVADVQRSVDGVTEDFHRNYALMKEKVARKSRVYVTLESPLGPAMLVPIPVKEGQEPTVFDLFASPMVSSSLEGLRINLDSYLLMRKGTDMRHLPLRQTLKDGEMLEFRIKKSIKIAPPSMELLKNVTSYHAIVYLMKLFNRQDYVKRAIENGERMYDELLEKYRNNKTGQSDFPFTLDLSRSDLERRKVEVALYQRVARALQLSETDLRDELFLLFGSSHYSADDFEGLVKSLVRPEWEKVWRIAANEGDEKLIEKPGTATAAYNVLKTLAVKVGKEIVDRYKKPPKLKDMGTPDDDSEKVFEEADQQALIHFSENRKSEVQTMTFDGTPIRYTVVKYDPNESGDLIGQFARANDATNAFHVPSDTVDGTNYVFVSVDAVDSEFYVQHELYEISIRNRLGQQIVRDGLPPGFDLQRVVHILAWARQIADRVQSGQWKDAKDSRFIQSQFERMMVEKPEVLADMALEDRSAHQALYARYLTHDQTVAVNAFEASVRQYVSTIDPYRKRIWFLTAGMHEFNNKVAPLAYLSLLAGKMDDVEDPELNRQMVKALSTRLPTIDNIELARFIRTNGLGSFLNLIQKNFFDKVATLREDINGVVARGLKRSDIPALELKIDEFAKAFGDYSVVCDVLSQVYGEKIGTLEPKYAEWLFDVRKEYVEETGKILEEVRTNELDQSKKPVDLAASLTDIISKYGNRFEVEIDLPEGRVPPAFINERHFKQIVKNLLLNAYQAIPEGRQAKLIISLNYDAGAGRFYIRIRDNGNGIPEENLRKVFLPYFTTKGSQGSGIGLAISKEMMQLARGDISVQSQVGEWTEFTMEYPAMTFEDAQTIDLQHPEDSIYAGIALFYDLVKDEPGWQKAFLQRLGRWMDRQLPLIEAGQRGEILQLAMQRAAEYLRSEAVVGEGTLSRSEIEDLVRRDDLSAKITIEFLRRFQPKDLFFAVDLNRTLLPQRNVQIALGPSARVSLSKDFQAKSQAVMARLASDVTTDFNENTFHESMGMIVGRVEGDQFIIDRLIPVTEFEERTTEHLLFPSRRQIMEIIDTQLGPEEKVLGLYHNHSFERLRSGARPGPSGVDAIRADLDIPGYEDRIAENRLGLVVEPYFNRTLGAAWGEHYDPSNDPVLIYSYITPRQTAGIVNVGQIEIREVVNEFRQRERIKSDYESKNGISISFNMALVQSAASYADEPIMQTDTGEDVSGIARMKELVKTRSQTAVWHIGEREIIVHVDRELLEPLEMSVDDFLALMSQVLARDHRLTGKDYSYFPGEMTFGALERSPQLFTSSAEDAFLGINRTVFKDIKESQNRSFLVETILAHQLRHQSLLFERQALLEYYQTIRSLSPYQYQTIFETRENILSGIAVNSDRKQIVKKVQRRQWSADKEYMRGLLVEGRYAIPTVEGGKKRDVQISLLRGDLGAVLNQKSSMRGFLGRMSWGRGLLRWLGRLGVIAVAGFIAITPGCFGQSGPGMSGLEVLPNGTINFGVGYNYNKGHIVDKSAKDQEAIVESIERLRAQIPEEGEFRVWVLDQGKITSDNVIRYEVDDPQGEYPNAFYRDGKLYVVGDHFGDPDYLDGSIRHEGGHLEKDLKRGEGIEDADRDGISNQEEVAKGTDPQSDFSNPYGLGIDDEEFIVIQDEVADIGPGFSAKIRWNGEKGNYEFKIESRVPYPYPNQDQLIREAILERLKAELEIEKDPFKRSKLEELMSQYEQDSNPDGGAIGKWKVSILEGPKDGRIRFSLEGIMGNEGVTVPEQAVEVSSVSLIMARAIINQLDQNLREAKGRNIASEDEKTIRNIISHLEEMVRQGKVYLTDDNEFVKGYGGKDLILISKKLFYSKNIVEAAIALFHEAGESFYANPSNPLPSGLNAHTFLRGLGKGVRDGIRPLTKIESALPERNNQKVGLQDLLFGPEENIVSLKPVLDDTELKKLERRMIDEDYPEELIAQYQEAVRSWERELKRSGAKDPRKNFKVYCDGFNDSKSLNNLLESLYLELKTFEYGRGVEILIVEHSDNAQVRQENERLVQHWNDQLESLGRPDLKFRYVSLEEQFDLVRRIGEQKKLDPSFIGKHKAAKKPEDLVAGGFAGAKNMSLMLAQSEVDPRDENTVVLLFDQDAQVQALLKNPDGTTRRRKVAHYFHNISQGFDREEVGAVASTLNGNPGNSIAGIYDAFRSFRELLENAETPEDLERALRELENIKIGKYSGLLGIHNEDNKNLSGQLMDPEGQVGPFGTGFALRAKYIGLAPLMSVNRGADVYYQLFLKSLGVKIKIINTPVIHEKSELGREHMSILSEIPDALRLRLLDHAVYGWLSSVSGRKKASVDRLVERDYNRALQQAQVFADQSGNLMRAFKYQIMSGLPEEATKILEIIKSDRFRDMGVDLTGVESFFGQFQDGNAFWKGILTRGEKSGESISALEGGVVEDTVYDMEAVITDWPLRIKEWQDLMASITQMKREAEAQKQEELQRAGKPLALIPWLWAPFIKVLRKWGMRDSWIPALGGFEEIIFSAGLVSGLSKLLNLWMGLDPILGLVVGSFASLFLFTLMHHKHYYRLAIRGALPDFFQEGVLVKMPMRPVYKALIAGVSLVFRVIYLVPLVFLPFGAFNMLIALPLVIFAHGFIYNKLISTRYRLPVAVAETTKAKGVVDPRLRVLSRSIMKDLKDRKLTRNRANRLDAKSVSALHEIILQRLAEFEGVDLDDLVRDVVKEMSKPKGKPKSKRVAKGKSSQTRKRKADFIGTDFIQRVDQRLSDQGYPKEHVQAILQLLNDPEVPGATWIDSKTPGRISGSRFLVRLLDRLSRMTEPDETKTWRYGDGVRENLIHEYMHQLLGDLISPKDEQQLSDQIQAADPEFIRAFTERYGAGDVEEILAKYLSLGFGQRAESLQLFEKVKPVLVSYLERKSIYQIDYPSEKSFRETVRDADKGFLKKFKARFRADDVKTVFLKYRQLKMLSEEGRLDEQGKADLEMFNRVQMEMDMSLGERVTLPELLKGENPKRVLVNVIRQVPHRVDLKRGRDIDAKILNMAKELGSFGLRYLNQEAKGTPEIFAGQRKYIMDFNLLVGKVKDKQGLVQGQGLPDALRDLFHVQPGIEVVIPSPLSQEKTRELLLSLGVDESMIGEGKGKVRIAPNWLSEGKIGDIYKALGYQGEDLKRAEQEVVVLLSEETRGKLTDFKDFAKRMKMAVGRIGKGKNEGLIPDVIALGSILGRVDSAFEGGKLVPDLERQLRSFYLEILKEYRKIEKDQDALALVDQMIQEVQADGFFKVPTPTDTLNEMMRELVIQDAYFEVAA